MRCEVLIVISIKIPGFWVWCNVVWYIFTDILEEGFVTMSHSKAEGSCFLRNVNIFLNNNMSLSSHQKTNIYTKQIVIL